MKRLCVFCGSSAGRSPAFVAAAREMGTLLARRRIGVVFGGGHVGMMGAVADAALAAGGDVIGVIPSALVERELAHRGVRDLRVVPSMHERKQLMHDLSDGFAALPGGLGTLDELFESMTWLQLGVHAKPVGLVNVEGYFDPLLAFLDRMTESGFVRAAERATLLSAPTAAELLDAFDRWQAPPTKRWLGRRET